MNKGLEAKLKSELIEAELKDEMRGRIVAVFDTYGGKENAERLCDIFPSIIEIEAAYHFVIDLNWRVMMQTACNSIELAISIYSPNYNKVA